MTQRRKKAMKGYSAVLAPDKVERLNKLGFIWSIKPEPSSSWSAKLGELEQYKVRKLLSVVFNPYLESLNHS
jgi:hypothetical protein